MSVPIVKKCCFCVNLHTAALLIGILYSIWTLAELIGSCVLVTMLPLGTDGKVSTHKRVLYITAVVVCCVHLLFSVLLVVAVLKNIDLIEEEKKPLTSPEVPKEMNMSVEIYGWIK